MPRHLPQKMLGGGVGHEENFALAGPEVWQVLSEESQAEARTAGGPRRVHH